MSKDQKKEKFLICPNCSGSGKGEMGFSCYNCQGMGQGMFFKNRFLYFDLKLNKKNVKFPLLKDRLDKIVDITTFVLGFLGVFSLAFWYYFNYSNLLNWEEFLFWRYQDGLILVFWLGLIFFMFGFYKLKKEKQEEMKIPELPEIEEDLPRDWEDARAYKHKINTAHSLSGQAEKVLFKAYKMSRKFKHKNISPIHIFTASLVSDTEVTALFVRLNLDQKSLMDKIKRQLDKQERVQDGRAPWQFDPRTKKVFIQAYVDAYDQGQQSIRALNLLDFCVQEDKMLGEILLDLKVDAEKIANIKDWFRINKEIRRNLERYRKLARFKPKSNMDRAYTSVATPFLNRCSYDLTLAAKWGKLDMCVSRDKEIKQVFDALSGSNNGVILVGDEGVGKKTIIKGVARMMVKEEVPSFLWDKRLLELDVARLASGADPAQVEERILRILDEIFRAGNIVLYIKNINNLVGIKIGKEGGMDLSEALIDGLSRRGIYCLATCSMTNYYQYVENSSLSQSMAEIKIEEPLGNKAIRIVESKIGRMEAKFKGVFFTYNAIEQAVNLSQRYIHDKHLPKKAIEILEQTGIRLFESKPKKEKYVFCGKDDVALTIKQITNIPVDTVSEEEGRKLLDLEKEIHKYMINQNEAVDVVANSLRRARVELKEEKRTIANFLFLGPTGVGKTELAKTVARVYLGKKDFMFRVDMSEYQHADSVKKMIGDAGGRKGYLTEAVRKNPFSLVLLDEFEKAHPKIMELFLQVMDDGRLTDGQGNTIDFTSSIIIATSNAGSEYIKKQISVGQDIEKIKEVLINDKLMEVMKPELINRFDGVIIFKPLSMKNIVEITGLMLKDISKMLEKIAEEGYDPKFGARPLRRVLRQKVENPVAKKILGGELERRDTVVIDDNADIKVKKAKEL